MNSSEIKPHFYKSCWSCGTFSIAFAWVTVFYAAAHALHGVDLCANQMSRRISSHGPIMVDGVAMPIGLPRGHVDGLLTLLLIYLSVCLFAGLLSVRLRLRDGDKVIVLAEACDFFPSPIFSGCLMAYLGSFQSFGWLGDLLRAFAASWVIAAAGVLAPAVANLFPAGTARDYAHVVARVSSATVVFGLGIAWNQVVSDGLEGLLPKGAGVVSHTIYVLIVALLTLRVTANPSRAAGFPKRRDELLAFAFKVVAAFALVAWASALVGLFDTGTDAQVLVLLLMVPLNALLSAIVANVDLAPRADEPREWNLWTWLVLCPCVWCCCPGVLVLWLLASNVDPSVAREHWLDMFSFVTGLAASVVASGLVVTAVDAAAAAMNVDSHWGFVAVAAAVASLLSAVITVALEPLVPSCAAPRLPVAEPVYSDAVYDQVRESTVLAVENAKHAAGMA